MGRAPAAPAPGNARGVGSGGGPLTQRLRRDPTIAELADTLGVESSDITRARECGAAYWAVSLDLPADHDGSRVELVADESSDIERLLRHRSVRQARRA